MLKQLVKRWTATPLVGVDIGSAAIKAVELERAPGGVLLRRSAIVPVDGGDAGGALKRLLEATPFSTSRAVLGLASPELIVKPFAFPPMPRKELRNAIQLEAEQAILNGHTMAEMVIDWHLLSSSKESIRGLLSVVPKAIISTRLVAAKAAGLRPSILDVEGLALWNAYWVLEGAREGARTVLLINVGARTTNLVIARGPDELMLVRDIQLGGEALRQGQKDEWIAEIRDSLSYARSTAGLRALDAVAVTGGASGPALLPLVKAAVSAPIAFWNPLASLPYAAQNGAPVNLPAGPLLAIAIGLALRQP